MNARTVFLTDAGALRPLWRVVLFLALLLPCWFVAALALGPLFTKLFWFVGLPTLSNETWVGAATLIGATVVSVKLIDRRPWSDFWLGADAARPRHFIDGFVIGAAAIAVPIVVLVAAGWLDLVPADAATSWGGAALRVSLFLLPAALSEELGTRGYLFTVLREKWGWKTTLVVTSVGFGLLHLQNAGANVVSITLVTLAGLFLGGVLVATRSLYAAWMAHFAWNWTMAVLFHTAVSGIPLETPGYRYVDAGPDWATGGGWGPEGGIPAALGMGAGAGAAFLLARRRARRNTAEALSG